MLVKTWPDSYYFQYSSIHMVRFPLSSSALDSVARVLTALKLCLFGDFLQGPSLVLPLHWKYCPTLDKFPISYQCWGLHLLLVRLNLNALLDSSLCLLVHAEEINLVRILLISELLTLRLLFEKEIDCCIRVPASFEKEIFCIFVIAAEHRLEILNSFVLSSRTWWFYSYCIRKLKPYLH